MVSTAPTELRREPTYSPSTPEPDAIDIPDSAPRRDDARKAAPSHPGRYVVATAASTPDTMKDVEINVSKDGKITLKNMPFADAAGNTDSRVNEVYRNSSGNLYNSVAKGVATLLYDAGAENYQVGDKVFNITTEEGREAFAVYFSTNRNASCIANKPAGQSTGDISLPGKVVDSPKFTIGPKEPEPATAPQPTEKLPVSVRPARNGGLNISNVPFTDPTGNLETRRQVGFKNAQGNMFKDTAMEIGRDMIAAGIEKYQIGEITYTLNNPAELEAFADRLAKDKSALSIANKNPGTTHGTITIPGTVVESPKFEEMLNKEVETEKKRKADLLEKLKPTVNLEGTKISRTATHVTLDNLPFVDVDGTIKNVESTSYAPGTRGALNPANGLNVAMALKYAGVELLRIGPNRFDFNDPESIQDFIRFSASGKYKCEFSKAAGELRGQVVVPGMVLEPKEFTGGVLESEEKED